LHNLASIRDEPEGRGEKRKEKENTIIERKMQVKNDQLDSYLSFNPKGPEKLKKDVQRLSDP